MPNDAKLGLIIGVVLVIAVATLFFQGQPPVSPEAKQPTATEVQTPPSPPSAAALMPAPNPPVRPGRESKGQTTSHIQE